MKYLIKIFHWSLGAYEHVQIYSGKDEDSLGFAGFLVLPEGEWDMMQEVMSSRQPDGVKTDFVQLMHAGPSESTPSDKAEEPDEPKAPSAHPSPEK